MSLGNPQSLNRFAYVENQPTNFVDPTGLLVEGEICQINGQVDGGGNPVYQGTVVNGRCQSHAGSSVQSFGWLFSLLFGLGGNPQVNFGQMQNDFPSIGPPTGGVPNKPEGPCMGIGISFSGTAIVGTGGNVAGGTGGWFLGHKPDDGQTFFGSSGSAVLGGSGQPGGVGYPSRQAGGFGGYLDAGPSLLLTRGSSDQLGGTTTTHMFGSPLLSIQMGMNADQKTWQTLEIGPPAIGFGYFKIQTQASKPIVANTPLRARLTFLCGGK